MKTMRDAFLVSAAVLGLVALAAAPATADQVILDDLIVDGSICAGLDCVNGESFGFDTLRLKENNLRVKFQDTSSSASFPTQDWQLTANDSSNGGANRFSIESVNECSRNIFTIEACGPNHSLYVDDGGRIGFGTNNPVVELHVVDGDSPTLRLEQDGSSGFTAQTWDVAGNEANFFVRDATNGSKLPFKIIPNAPTNSLVLRPNGVVLGANSEQGAFHVENTTGDDVDDFIVSSDGQVGVGVVPAQDLHVGPTTNANAGIRLQTASHSWDFFVTDANGNWGVSKVGVAGNQLTLDPSGNLILPGNCSDAPGGGGCTPDYVFEPDYELRSLDELAEFVALNRHLPNVPSAEDNAQNGVNVRALSFSMLEKIEELVLYTLQQQETIDSLTARLAALEEAREQ